MISLIPESCLSDWHKHYLECAESEARMSKDPSSKFGAIIVSDRNFRVSSGVNGFPKGFKDTPERWNDRDFKYKHVIHAEENALLHAPADCTGYSIFVSGVPCSSCMGKIAQKGISTVFCYEPTEDYLSRWSVDHSYDVAEECGVKIVLVQLRNSQVMFQDANWTGKSP